MSTLLTNSVPVGTPAADVPGGHRLEVIALRPAVLVMTSGLNAVAGGGSVPGWVSGDIGGVTPLAASAQAYVVFDLGPMWDQYVMLSCIVYPMVPSSGLSGVQVLGSDTTVYSGARRKNSAAAIALGSIYASALSASGAADLNFRPSGRYVIVIATNADAVNALGAGSKITLTAYPA
jgi:hypothetical protein